MSQEDENNQAGAESAADVGAAAENQTVDAPQSQTSSGVDSPDDALARAQRERDDYYDRLLRKTAEFDNFRKRIDRDRREQMEWAAADLLSEVIGVLDDFERALKVEAPPEAQPYRAGVELIHRQLSELVRKRGATPIEALGTDFDPAIHQAVSYEETPGAREGQVVAEFTKGYRLGDRLLRPALVKVAKAS